MFSTYKKRCCVLTDTNTKRKTRKNRVFLFGAGNVTRTHDLLITNQLLYRLSYTSIFILPKYYNSITLKKQDRNLKKVAVFFI